MILASLLTAFGLLAELLEAGIDLVVPDSWLAILRRALHGTGTPLVQAALYRFNPTVVNAVAVTFDLLVVLILARYAIKFVRYVRTWLP